MNTPNDPIEIEGGTDKQGVIIGVEKNSEVLVSADSDFQTENKSMMKKDPLVSQETMVIANSQDIETVFSEERTSIGTEDMASFETQKIKDIVNNVHTVAQNNQEVTEAYIDSLLWAAEKDIQRQKFER